MVAAVALAATFSLAGHAGAIQVTPHAPEPAAKPGPAGSPITLARHVEISTNGVDIATSKSGTAYVGWIANRSTSHGATLAVHLCVLPLHATACKGGVQSTPSLDKTTARDLKVLASDNGTVTFVWWDDKTTATPGARDGQIVESTVANGSFSGAKIVATAPTNGELLDAELGPKGTVWSVTENPSGTTIEVGPVKSPVALHTPFSVGFSRIAFSGSSAVVVVQKDGAITIPDSYTYSNGNGWAKFHSIAGVWAGANPSLVSTRSGIRYIGTINDADYYPVVSRWAGHSFTSRQLTGDTSSCSPSTHDAVTDASGRVADVSAECDTKLAVDNLADTYHAGITRIRTAGDIAGTSPQIATTPRGDAWVTWSVESGGSELGLTLKVLAVRLPGLQQKASKQGQHGRVTLTGPASCLPDDTISVAVAGHGDAPWAVTSHKITLGSKRLSSTLDGASLRAGQLYTLKGTVTFSKGGAHSTTSVEIRFRACAAP